MFPAHLFSDVVALAPVSTNLRLPSGLLAQPTRPKTLIDDSFISNSPFVHTGLGAQMNRNSRDNAHTQEQSLDPGRQPQGFLSNSTISNNMPTPNYTLALNRDELHQHTTLMQPSQALPTPSINLYFNIPYRNGIHTTLTQSTGVASQEIRDSSVQPYECPEVSIEIDDPAVSSKRRSCQDVAMNTVPLLYASASAQTDIVPLSPDLMQVEHSGQTGNQNESISIFPKETKVELDKDPKHVENENFAREWLVSLARMATEPYLFACEFCPRKFQRETERKRHLRVLHPVSKPFHCQSCARRFYNSDLLKRHVHHIHRRNPGFREKENEKPVLKAMWHPHKRARLSY